MITDSESQHFECCTRPSDSSGTSYSCSDSGSTAASEEPNELHCVVLRCVATASERIRKSVIMSTLTISYQSCPCDRQRRSARDEHERGGHRRHNDGYGPLAKLDQTRDPEVLGERVLAIIVGHHVGQDDLGEGGRHVHYDGRTEESVLYDGRVRPEVDGRQGAHDPDEPGDAHISDGQASH